MRGLVMVLCVAACASSDDGGSPKPGADAAAPVVEKCGDGVCAATEIGTCTADCGAAPTSMCGNGTCEANETQQACPADCTTGVCGDGTCNSPGESMANCPGDCATSSGAVCGNAVCETGETAANCPLDCSATSTCPGGDDIGCFFCWFDPTMCIPPQTEPICAACLGL